MFPGLHSEISNNGHRVGSTAHKIYHWYKYCASGGQVRAIMKCNMKNKQAFARPFPHSKTQKDAALLVPGCLHMNHNKLDLSVLVSSTRAVPCPRALGIIFEWDCFARMKHANRAALLHLEDQIGSTREAKILILR